MKLEDLFKNKKHGKTYYEKLIGKENVEKCAVLYDNYGELIENIETAVLISSLHDYNYSSEEIKMFKMGLIAVKTFIGDCKLEHENSKEVIKIKKDKGKMY